MKNEEMILQLLAELKAGQDELRAGQDELRAGQDELRAGQDELRAGQDELRAGQDAPERAAGKRWRRGRKRWRPRCATRAYWWNSGTTKSAWWPSSMAMWPAKLDTLLHKAAQVDELRSRTSTLETVVAHHTAELQAMRQAH